MRLLDNLRRWAHMVTADKQEVDIKFEKYYELYNNDADWITNSGGRVRGMNIAKGAIQELTRTIYSEFKLEANKDVSKTIQKVRKLDEEFIEFVGAYGEALIVPYVSGNRSGYNIYNPLEYTVELNRFGEVEKAEIYTIQMKKENKKDIYYTIEETHIYHELESKYTIEYKLFKSDNINAKGTQVNIKDYKEYLNITEYIEIVDVDSHYCVYVKKGKSIFEPVYNLIEDLDRQYSRVLWEYEGGELAVDADISLFREIKTANDNTVLKIPFGKDRLFRRINASNLTGKAELPMSTFAPTLRDDSYWSGVNQIKRGIEFGLGFAYGTLSEPGNVAMTATEILASKQRYYSTIKHFQTIVEEAYTEALRKLLELENKYLGSDKEVEFIFKFNDSILTTSKERIDELSILLSHEIITKEEFRETYFKGK